MNSISFSDSYKKLVALHGECFKVVFDSVCNHLKCNPLHLAALIMHESGGSPSIVNKDSSSVGLIQFMPGTCRSLGYTPEEMGNLSASEQIIPVLHYFLPFRGRLSNFEDLCLACFYPLAVGKPSTFQFPDRVVNMNKTMFKYGSSKGAYIQYLNEKFTT